MDGESPHALATRERQNAPTTTDRFKSPSFSWQDADGSILYPHASKVFSDRG
jgi:hypothetical protein